MPAIPPYVLRKLYARNSLRDTEQGFALDLKNVIAPGTILAVNGLEVDGVPVQIRQITVVDPEGASRPAGDISADQPLAFPQGATFTVRVAGTTLQPGEHELALRVVVQDIGPLEIPVIDRVA